MPIYIYIYIQTEYTLVNIYRKNISKGLRVSQTNNSNGTFTFTNSGIKKNPNSIATIKVKKLP